MTVSDNCEFSANSYCVNALPSVTDSFFGFAIPTCALSYGGPVILQGKLVGIVSASNRFIKKLCDGIEIAKVANFVNWIQTVI